MGFQVRCRPYQSFSSCFGAICISSKGFRWGSELFKVRETFSHNRRRNTQARISQWPGVTFKESLYRSIWEIITLELDIWRWQKGPPMCAMKLSFRLRNDVNGRHLRTHPSPGSLPLPTSNFPEATVTNVGSCLLPLLLCYIRERTVRSVKGSDVSPDKGSIQENARIFDFHLCNLIIP